MFSTNDINSGWNGTAGGLSVLDGVYVYIAKISYKDDRTANGEKVVQGSVLVAK